MMSVLIPTAIRLDRSPGMNMSPIPTLPIENAIVVNDFIGRVIKLDRSRGYGFLAGPNNEDVFFHVKQLGVAKTEIGVGSIISGSLRKGPKGLLLSEVKTFSTPEPLQQQLDKPALCKVCWYDPERRYGFADLLDGSLGPSIMFHIQHLKIHGRHDVHVGEVFLADLIDFRGSGRVRVQSIIKFDQSHV